MKHRPRPPEQDDLLRPRLVDLIDMRHELVKLAAPIDPTSLTRWRKRIGEEGVEWLLIKTIEAGRKSGAVESWSLEQVAVDTTVMEKNIAHPTDCVFHVMAGTDSTG